ncbi:MAG TPA: hypothetical protein VD813_04695, partial [Pseudonocardia sp.]|nr:hypothetical protein [Pseudonocardia sp.]
AHRPRRSTPRGRYARLRAGRPAMPSRSGPPSVGGRWAPAVEREPDPTRRAHARAEAFLERHGVLTRGALSTERSAGGFAGVYRVLRAMEDSGRCRRGYVVEGLGAAQFAVPGAIDRLRALSRPDGGPVGAGIGSGFSGTHPDPRTADGAGSTFRGTHTDAGTSVYAPDDAEPAFRGTHTGDDTGTAFGEPHPAPPTTALAPDQAEPAFRGTPLGRPDGAAAADERYGPRSGPVYGGPRRATGRGPGGHPAGSGDPGLPRVVLAAADPAQPYGAALAWPETVGETKHRPGRKAGALVVLVDGAPVLYVERGGRSLLSFSTDHDELRAAAQALAGAVHEGWLGSLAVERTDGVGSLGSELAEVLTEAGFRVTPKGLRLRA